MKDNRYPDLEDAFAPLVRRLQGPPWDRRFWDLPLSLQTFDAYRTLRPVRKGPRCLQEGCPT